MGMMKEFKEFAMKGNVLDLAVGVIIGAAFGTIVTSFVNDVLMPPIGLALGRVDFKDLFVMLDGTSYPSLALAKASGHPVLAYGQFLNAVINFIIVAFAVFLLVKNVNRWTRPKPAAEVAPTNKDCPFCLTSIPIKAVRCPACTSALDTPQAARL